MKDFKKMAVQAAKDAALAAHDDDVNRYVEFKNRVVKVLDKCTFEDAKIRPTVIPIFNFTKEELTRQIVDKLRLLADALSADYGMNRLIQIRTNKQAATSFFMFDWYEHQMSFFLCYRTKRYEEWLKKFCAACEQK